ncbi:MAG: hypothetical protein ACU837_05825 [Gammaproteobacteria bacterium]
MTEVLFIITIIFVAYVVYAALGNPGKSAPASSRPPAHEEVKPEAALVTESVAVAADKPAAEAKSVEAEVKKPSVAAEKTANSIRDPNSGEIAAIPANYRFAKRWIKEALVAEGLLDKIYKNGELDEATSAKVKQALETLKTMEKYRI